jgi:ABC-type multidrug transport system fused ATPase/permease subunit
MMKQTPEASDDHLPQIDQVRTIAIKDVSFSYNIDKEVIHNFSAHWKSGQTIAFV